MSGGASCDPGRTPRGWAPEAWRLRCTVCIARQALPYASADARLLDGVDKWLLWTGRGKPVPGPWWALACALTSAMAPCLASSEAARLVAPWCHGGTVPSGDIETGFRPLGG